MTNEERLYYLSLPRIERIGSDYQSYLNYANALKDAGYPEEDVRAAFSDAEFELQEEVRFGK